MRKADYGVDAPGVVQGLLIAAISSVLLGVAGYRFLKRRQSRWAKRSLGSGILFGMFFSVPGASMLWSSRIGKLRARDQIMESIPWRGDEMVLDVGCGRGLLLIEAAKHLTTGTAVGIDIWSQTDQSANRPESTWRNALAEEVADRIQVKDADARQLPFDDKSFDTVLSSLVLHNIPDRSGRAQAVQEIARVLKPGGRAVIVDVARTGEYERVLRSAGLQVAVSRPFFLFSPVARMLMAQKPT